LLRRPGRRLSEGGARQRPPVVRRGLLLLASGLAAGVIAPHAAGDPTSTTPAPDPNPPAGAAPDPYSPPAKTTPSKPAPAPVHVAPRVYTPPRVVTPVHVATGSSTRTYTPRPVVTHPRVTHKTRKAARHTHRRARHVVQHKHKSVVVRVTPAVRSYVVSFVHTLSATVVDPAESGGSGRRRAAGLALAALCASSLSLILLAARSRRNVLS
jgi:hypothetical protein